MVFLGDRTALPAKYQAQMNDIEEKTRGNTGTAVSYTHLNCGHIHCGSSAPQVCPICKHSQAYFELRAENY